MEKAKEEYINIEEEEEVAKDSKYDVIDKYINDTYLKDFKIALGICCILISLSSPMLIQHYYSTILFNITAIIWIGLNIAGIILIIKAINSFKCDSYIFPVLPIEYKNFLYDNYYLASIKQGKRLKTIGIILCVFCLFPAMLFNGLNESLIDLGNCLFFIMLGIGVFLIKISSSKTKAYKFILNIKK